METIIEIHLPLKRVQRKRFSDWILKWGGGSITEFGGSRINTVRHLSIFGWHVLTIHWNEYHDRSETERANEYLKKWSECEKELRGLRLLLMGDSTLQEVKKVIRESLGVDLDEGTIR